jgi:phage/plasmid primase-like uncharacterized protein
MAFGRSGALKVTLTGQHRGKWKDWSDNNRSGDLITLIKDQRNISYTEAVIEASKIIGQPTNFSIMETKNSDQLASENTVTKSNSYEYGQRIWQEGQPIKGTLAEKYLKHRGIENTELTGLRYHYGVYTKESPTNYQPALVASFTDKDRNINSVEVIYLDRETGQKAQGFHTGKKTYGSKNGAVIDLSPYNQDTNISLITEGVITGLSVKEAYPNEHILAVGGKENIANISPDMLNDKVIICADNDGKDISQDKSLYKAIDILKEAGKSVEIVAPNNISNQQKVDFNDTLTHQGVDSIKEKIDNIISKLDNNLAKNELENHILSEININELAKDINLSEQHSVEALVKEYINNDINNDINIDELTKDIEDNNSKILDKDLEL